MPQIPKSILKKLNAINLSQLVSEHTELIKGGREYKGPCPFPDHSDNDPSFFVNPSKNLFFCHGCHKGGGPIQFIMSLFDLSFIEAAKLLGEKFGIQITSDDSIDKIYEILELATGVYEEMLRDNSQVKAYLHQRGLDGATIREFRLGWSPSDIDQDGFTQILQKQYSVEDLIRAGLSVKLDSGKVVDCFRDRLIIPIQNIRGKVIAFGGRTLGDRKPKYINSPDSPTFTKRRTLFNLHRADEASKSSKRMILFEDYFSVLVAHRFGVKDCLGSMGTAVSDFLVKICHRVSRGDLILCLDPDNAGDIAAIKTSIHMIAEGTPVKIAQLPKDIDPDEYILRDGVGSFVKIIQDAKEPTIFIGEHLQKSYDLNTAQGQVSAAQAISEMMKEIDVSISQLVTSQAIAQSAGVKVDIPRTTQLVAEYKTPQRIEMTTSEVELFSTLLQHPEHVDKIVALEPSGLTPVARLLYDSLISEIDFDNMSEGFQSIYSYLNSLPMVDNPGERVAETIAILNIQSVKINLDSMLQNLDSEVTLSKEFLEIFTELSAKEKQYG